MSIEPLDHQLQSKSPVLEELGSKNTGTVIIAAGVITAVCTLLLDYLLLHWTEELAIMGLYVWFIIPAGAIALGALAGSGYGLASWIKGAKVGRLLLIVIVAVQAVAYCGAQYVEYLDVMAMLPERDRLDLWTYYDVVTRSISFQPRYASESSSGELGGLGYLVRGLEFCGFVCGGLVAPVCLMFSPYCQHCQRYNKNKLLGMIPAGLELKSFRLTNSLNEEALESKLEAGHQAMAEFSELANADAIEPIKVRLAELKQERRKINRMTHRIVIRLMCCPQCYDGHLKFFMDSNSGNQHDSEEIASMKISPRLTQALLEL